MARQPDLTGLGSHHRVSEPSPVRWVVVALVTAAVVLQDAVPVTRHGEGRYLLYGVLGVVLLTIVVLDRLRPTGTDLDADGVRTRRHYGRVHQVPWDRVASVQPPGPGEHRSTVQTVDGGVVWLPGVTPWVAERLAERLDP